MHVGEVHAAAASGGRRRKHRLQPAPAAPVPAVPSPDAKVSKAGGDWKFDAVRARHDANLVLNGIDWSKRDLVIWVPGTDNHSIHPAFETAVRESWANGGVSLNKLEYEASWNMRPSTATGIATLKLVLAGIAAHGGDHRVMLAGESQGAWVIGEALTDPMLRKVVDRAVLLGHPFLAEHHYEQGEDSAVIEINHAGDQVSAPIRGNLEQALDAMSAIHQMNIGGIGDVVGAIVQNPQHGVMLLESAFRSLFLKGLVKDPHDYSPEMTRAVEYLRFGNADDGTQLDLEQRRSQLMAALAVAHAA